MLDILISQRISRHFRDVINDSISLQRKLFFVADAPVQRWVQYVCSDGYFDKVDITEPEPPLCEDNGHCCARHGWSAWVPSTPAVLNPLFTEQPRAGRNYNRRTTKGYDQISLCYARTTCLLDKELPVVSREASWRRMYLCDPSPYCASAKFTFAASTQSTHSVEAQIKNADRRDHVDVDGSDKESDPLPGWEHAVRRRWRRGRTTESNATHL